MKNEKNATPNGTCPHRKYWVDSLRAFAMIFVVLVHASNGLPHWDKYNVLIGPVMIPLFFAISGYLFNIGEGRSLVFYKKLALKLILPWFVLSLIWAKALLIPFKGFSPFFTEQFYGFISGEVLWYFSCCIFAEIIQFYVIKFAKKFEIICLTDLILCIFGFILVYFNIGGFLNINKAFIAQFFIMLGYIFRNKETWFSKLNWKSIGFLALGYFGLAALSMVVFPGQHIDVNRNMYPNIPLYFALITIGIFLMFWVVKKINVKYRLLVFIGQNTLIIYSMHSLGFFVIKGVLSKLNINLPSNWLFAILLSIISISLCGVGALFVNKFLPEIVGKRRIKNL